MATVEKVQEALEGRQIAVGQTEVRSVQARIGADSNGDPAIFLTIVLSNPPDDLETWPAEDIDALRRAIRDVIDELDSEIPWVISLQPEDAGDLEPEDTRDQVQIDY